MKDMSEEKEYAGNDPWECPKHPEGGKEHQYIFCYCDRKAYIEKIKSLESRLKEAKEEKDRYGQCWKDDGAKWTKEIHAVQERLSQAETEKKRLCAVIAEYQNINDALESRLSTLLKASEDLENKVIKIDCYELNPKGTLQKLNDAQKYGNCPYCEGRGDLKKYDYQAMLKNLESSRIKELEQRLSKAEKIIQSQHDLGVKFQDRLANSWEKRSVEEIAKVLEVEMYERESGFNNDSLATVLVKFLEGKK